MYYNNIVGKSKFGKGRRLSDGCLDIIKSENPRQT